MNGYARVAAERAESLRARGNATILAIETSCDETAVAVVRGGRDVLSSEVASQIATHAPYGGVVPEIASREHVGAIDPLVDLALERAGVGIGEIDAVAVTYGPGLVGALLSGVMWAKAFAWALGLPLIPVNHIEGHICANFAAHADCAPPFLCLVVSGGHSEIARVLGYGRYESLGGTVDDAAGEAFDKIARALGIPYPGGPILDEIAERGDDRAYAFPKPRVEGRYDFSFSGLKTAAITAIRRAEAGGSAVDVPDFAASLRRSVVDALIEKLLRCAADEGAGGVAVAGGVAANRLLRRELAARCDALGIRLWLPPLHLCSDNAAMIGCAAHHRLMAGEIAGLRLNADPSAELFDPRANAP